MILYRIIPLFPTDSKACARFRSRRHALAICGTEWYNRLTEGKNWNQIVSERDPKTIYRRGFSR